MQARMKSGLIYGAGAAVNVQCGFIPTRVELFNDTDGTPLVTWHAGRYITFDGGGAADSAYDHKEIVSGMKIKDVTNGGYGTVKSVVLDTGAWNLGTAAGLIEFFPGTDGGTFADSGQIDVIDERGYNRFTDAATAATALNERACAVATAAATSTAITAYAGSSVLQPGFTVDASTAADGKILSWVAWGAE